LDTRRIPAVLCAAMTDAELRVRIVELDSLLRIDAEPAAGEPS
jgi:hypothetical protein